MHFRAHTQACTGVQKIHEIALLVIEESLVNVQQSVHMCQHASLHMKCTCLRPMTNIYAPPGPAFSLSGAFLLSHFNMAFTLPMEGE